jgi:hypothetical protein
MEQVPFYQTRMGQQFYERTLPELVRQVERLNGLLEKLVSEGKLPGSSSEGESQPASD